MTAKLKHLAIVSDQYTLLERFYQAMFGMKSSPDNPPAGAVVVSDGYVGLNINPRKGKAGRQAGLDHFGFEVEDVAALRNACQQANASTDVDKRPPNREAEYRVHDPDGNPIDLSQHGWPI